MGVFPLFLLVYYQDLLVSFSWLFSTLFASSRFVHILVTHPLSVNCWVRPFWACIWVPLWPSLFFFKDSSDGPDISSFPSAAEVSDSLDHILTVSVSVPGKRQNV